MTIYALGFNHTAVERIGTNARLETAGGFSAAVGSAVPLIPLGQSLTKFSMSLRLNTLAAANVDSVNPFMVFRSGTTELVRFYIVGDASSVTNGSTGLRILYSADGTTFVTASFWAPVLYSTTAFREPTVGHFDFSALGGIALGNVSNTLFTKRFNFTLGGPGTIDNIIFPANTGRTLTVLSYIFHDEPMHLCHLHPMTPDAAGAVNVGWSSATPATLTDTTTFATPSANNDYFTVNTTSPTNTGAYNASNFGFFGGYNKYFATIIAATRPSGAPALTNLASVIRVGGTDYYGANKVVPVEDVDQSYKPYFTVFETNPATGNAWTQGELDVLEFGARAQT